MTPYVLDTQSLTPALLRDLARGDTRFALAPAALDRMAHDRRVLAAHIAGGAPVYGLNTGLGGNLGYRLQEDRPPGADAQRIAEALFVVALAAALTPMVVMRVG